MSSEKAAGAIGTVWTIKALLLATAEYFFKKQLTETPREARLEAELLLAHVLSCKRIDLLVRYNEVPSETDRASYRELVRRRAEHWPTAYLIGSREFFLLPFEVSPAVLIPRPDTETLVIQALELAKNVALPRILDLGTGSGCIAVCLAHNLPGANVTAVDLSPDALRVAQKNAQTHGVRDRIQFFQGDLFQPVDKSSRFDLIVSNPPYITSQELAELEPEVRDHEPRLALDGGPDGLAFYRRIISQSSNFLTAKGSLLLEIGASQAEGVQALIAAEPTIQFVQIASDRSGIPRVAVAKRASALSEVSPNC